ncbi:MAG: hypothetical protein P1V81_16535 [Planctomycetota bacterium]|nr:hypothetical protein [Planctomycetota bacterium]
MHKNQKLGLTAIIAFGAAFGTWYALQGPEAEASGPAPVSPTATVQDRVDRRDKAMSLDLKHEVPDELKKVEKGLEARWAHLDEEMLTAASVDKDGEMVYFDKQVITGRTGDGKPLYAQGAHRVFVMDGPLIRDVTRQPITATIQPKKAPGSSYLFEALKNGNQADRGKMPQPKTPGSGQ